jgi:predicted MFS family arabinose efflux permease
MVKESHKKSFVNPWIVWAPVVLFFMYQFIARVFPGVMQDDIMRRFSISALEFGGLSSIYYISYASMQIPVGLLLDRYGPRLVACFFLLMIVGGIFLFVSASSWPIALIGRALIGMGSAGGLLSTAKVTRMIFTDKMYGTVLSISISIGVSGAIYGNLPLAFLIDYIGWESTLFVLLYIGLTLCFFIFIFVKNTDESSEKESNKSTSFIQNLISLKDSANVLKLAIYGGMIGPFLYTYGDAWGVSYLTSIHGLTKSQASGAISWLYLGLIVGMPITVYFGEKIQIEKILVVVYSLLTIVAFSILLYVQGLSYNFIIVLHFLFGLLCAYQILMFSLVAKEVSVEKNGFATSIVNMLNMAFGSIGIFLVGLIMDMNWTGTIDKGVHIYENFAYQRGFSILFVGLLLGSLGILTIKKDKK